jgi:tetratricopeptide (TPR) repeat protein
MDMASQEGPDQVPQQPGKREPLTPAVRKRLQKCFDHATKQMAQENYDYAADLLTQCVQGDPGNNIYVQNYLANLQKKYNNNRKGSPLAQFKERAARSAVKKAQTQEDWNEVINKGLAVLRVNPWDVPTLTSMSLACQALANGCTDKAEALGYLESELAYLKVALEPNFKDAEVNLALGKALGRRGLYDQAVSALHRVEQARPDDEEVKRAISVFLVEKARARKEFAAEEEPAKKAQRLSATPAQHEASETEKLRQKIARNPDEISTYIELAQFYLNGDQYKEAEEILAQAVKASHDDPEVADQLAEAQLRRLRSGLVQAEKHFKETGGEAEKTAVKQIRREIVEKELEVYKTRCQRYPSNLLFRFELGVRYYLKGDYGAAIKEFQQARNDPRRRGDCMLELGKSFYHIKQYRLAMSHYESAIEDIPDREADKKKEAFYRAGRLAYALGDLEHAEKHLSALAAMDFAYRDVSALLDKIAQTREDKEDRRGGEAPAEGKQEDPN